MMRVNKVKVREIIKGIEKDGWYLVNQEGSHRQFKHQSKKGRVTIAGNLGKPAGILLNSFGR